MVNGCFDKLLQLIEDNAVIIAAVALAIAALEVQKTAQVIDISLEELCVLLPQLL